MFEGLDIMKEGDAYLSHMGRYPVISLSLKSGKQPGFEMARDSLVDEIQKEFQRHKYILSGGMLDEFQKEKFESIRTGKAGKIEYAKALEFLSNCLEDYHNRKAIMLIMNMMYRLKMRSQADFMIRWLVLSGHYLNRR